MRLKIPVWLSQISPFLAVSLVLVWATSARAQTVVATIPVGVAPIAVAVNSVTNKIYVVNGDGTVTVIDGTSRSVTTVSVGAASGIAVNPTTNKVYVTNGGGVTVIDGSTNATTEINTGSAGAVAVNTVTNKIYVANPTVRRFGGPILSTGHLTVIDGATNATTTLTDNETGPVAVAVNPVTNKVYVVNVGSVTVIDGSTNSATTISLPNTSNEITGNVLSPSSIAVNTTTNKIYVVNNFRDIFYAAVNPGNVTVIDGATNSTTTISDPNAILPISAAVNPVTNKIYVANALDSALTGNGGVTVIDGATNAISTIRDPNAIYPYAVAVDSVTNTVYAANGGCFFLLEFPITGCGNHASVTVINGATNATTTVIDPSANTPAAIAVNSTTNEVYVANLKSQNTTVIDGGATATTHILSVLLAGNGTGTVTSNPAGISCGTSCTANFAAGSAVNLAASPTSGSEFSGWNTACTGTNTCSIIMTSDGFVTANFNTNIPPDFSLGPAYVGLGVQRGGQVTDVITIVPAGGSTLEKTIQLSCAVTGPMPMPTCALSPSSVAIGANPATSTLTITAPGLSAAHTPSNQGQLSSSLYAVFLPIPLALIGLGLAFGKEKPRTRRLWLLCGLFLSFVALQAGCGGGSSSPPPPSPLNYTVTITATSGSIQHTVQVTVTVQ